MALSKAIINKFNYTKKQIKELPEGKRERAAKLVQKLEFMNEELEKIQAIIAEKGWTEKYKNGENQYGVKKRTEGEVYNSLVKNFTNTMRTLDDILPKNEADADELEKWLDE